MQVVFVATPLADCLSLSSYYMYQPQQAHCVLMYVEWTHVVVLIAPAQHSTVHAGSSISTPISSGAKGRVHLFDDHAATTTHVSPVALRLTSPPRIPPDTFIALDARLPERTVPRLQLLSERCRSRGSRGVQAAVRLRCVAQPVQGRARLTQPRSTCSSSRLWGFKGGRRARHPLSPQLDTHMCARALLVPCLYRWCWSHS